MKRIANTTDHMLKKTHDDEWVLWIMIHRNRTENAIIANPKASIFPPLT